MPPFCLLDLMNFCHATANTHEFQTDKLEAASAQECLVRSFMDLVSMAKQPRRTLTSPYAVSSIGKSGVKPITSRAREKHSLES